jgi:hypothetical protein
MIEVRLGQLLVETGILDAGQVREVLAVQERTGEPFGLLAERLFGIAPEAVEEAWARQYAGLTRTVDPEVEVCEGRARELVSRRQAWQFRILPLRIEGRELVMATTQRHLRRALRFATNVIGVPVFFVLADAAPLGRALCRHYPLPGLTPDSVEDGGPARLPALRSARNAA